MTEGHRAVVESIIGTFVSWMESGWDSLDII